MSSTVLGERLTGNMIGGDAARTRYHKFAMEQFSKHPIVGVGVGGINYLQGVYSHSLFYETLGCTGLIGSLILAITFVKPLKSLIKRLFDNKKNADQKSKVYFNKTFFIYLLAILISGVAVVMIYDFDFYISLALIAAGMLLADESAR